MKPLPFALVTWRDAHSDSAQWEPEAVPHAPLIITTAGWVLREDEEGITLANEQVMDSGSITYRGRTFILAETIVGDPLRCSLRGKSPRRVPQKGVSSRITS